MQYLTLGPSWNEAIEQAYRFGYEYNSEASPETKERLSNNLLQPARYISGYTEIWDAIEVYYKEHRPDEYDQLMREAAVAEDLHVAFESGAIDALRDYEQNIDRVEMLKD